MTAPAIKEALPAPNLRPVSQGAACAALGLSFYPFKELLKHGALTRRREGRWKRVMLDPSWTLDCVYRHWLSQVRTVETTQGARLADPRDLERHYAIRWTCKIDPAEPQPAIMLHEVLRRLLPIGVINMPEVIALVPTNGPEAQSVVDELNRMAGLDYLVTGAGRAGTPPTSAAFAAALPVLKALRHTCFDDPELHDEPNQQSRRKLAKCGPLRAPLTVYAYCIAGTARRPERVETGVGMLARFDACFASLHPGADASDGQALEETITAILDGRFDGPGFAPAIGPEICSEWLLMTMLLRRVATLLDRDGGLGLKALVPADPSNRADLTARISKLRHGHRSAGRARRKVGSDKIADRLWEIEDAAALRMEQLIATADAARAARTLLGEADVLEFEVLTTVLDDKGRLVPGVQRCVWEAVRQGALLQQVRKNTAQPVFKEIDKHIRHHLAFPDEHPVVYRFVRVEAVGGGTAIEPWFVSLYRSGVLASPGSLPPRLQHLRLNMLRRWKLVPTAGTTMPGVFDRKRFFTLWRLAIARHRLIVDVEGFEHCMRFAHLGMRAVLESYARLSEFTQMVQTRNGWTKRTIDKRAVAGFLAYPKLSHKLPMPEHPSYFPLDDRTFVEMTELCALTARRTGQADGRLELTAHLPHVRWKTSGPARLVFAAGGHAYDNREMTAALRCLLVGYGPVTFHELRHAASNAAREAGVPPSVLAKALNHHGPSLRQTLWYARRTQRQQRRDHAAMIAVRSSRIADTVAKWDLEKEKAA